MKSLGLALGGGGLRGLAHIGVLQVLEENNIEVSMISGTSIGSIIGSLYACGWSAFEIEAIVLRLKPADYLDYNIGGFIRYIAALMVPGVNAQLNGIIKGCKLEKLMYRLTDGKRLADIKIPLSIIACDIDSGLEVVFTNSSRLVSINRIMVINNALISEAVRCSSSIPATFVPRTFHGCEMVDGGVKSIVPVWIQKFMGAEYILAVNLGQKEYTSPVSGLPQIVSRSINILTYETSDTEEKLFADMLIFPGTGDIAIDDLSKAREIIKMGRLAMKSKIPQLKRDLKQ
ncbi:hypothetical protein ASZ90_017376 [hydrocarbon metagenome]|uniref:PNPLA domain-containing protein n=1 Tax=hydrocarbon metagenome TaxID=938273 RepID=A0A0W8E9T3_9ZZZZ